MAPQSTNHARESLYADLVAKRLKAASDSLPPLSEITIEPHYGYDSEHPYRVLVGNTRPVRAQARKKVWVRLGRTPVRANQAPDMIYHISCHNSITIPFHSLENVDLVEPFRTLWERTRPSSMTDNMDPRKGWMKGLCYWYWATDAEQRAVQIRLPKSISTYLVGAAKRIGVMERDRNLATTNNVVTERNGTEKVGEGLERLEGLEMGHREAELRAIEDGKKKERMEVLREELRQVEGKESGNGVAAKGKITGTRGRDNGETGSDGPRKGYLRRGNNRRRPVVEEDPGSDNSASGFDTVYDFTPPRSTRPRSKRRKTNAEPEDTPPEPSLTLSDEQSCQRASSPRLLSITSPPITVPALSTAHLLSSLKVAISDAERFAADFENVEEEERGLKEDLERLGVRKLEIEELVKRNKEQIGELAGRLV